MELKLPPSLVSYADLQRVVRELQSRNEQRIKSHSQGSAAPNIADKALIDLAQLNNVDLEDEKVTRQLEDYLAKISQKLPQIHISFGTEPSPQVIEILIMWLRQHIHSSVLLGIGLQPSIGAGCILRTPNRVFDLSIRNYVNQQNNYLVELIKGAASGR